MAAVAGLPAAGTLTFATPSGWFSLTVPRTAVEAETLADELACAYRGATYSPEKLRLLIRDLSRAYTALAISGAYAAFYDTPTGPQPITLTTCVRSFGEGDLDQIAREAADQEATQVGVDSIDLPSGPAIRLQWLRQWPEHRDRHGPVSWVVQYVVTSPGLALAAMMTFTSPAAGLNGHLLAAFDQIAGTVRFAEPRDSGAMGADA